MDKGTSLQSAHTVQSQMGCDGSDPKNDRHMKDGEENKNADGSKDSVDLTIPIEAVDEISSRFNNTLYGYFIGKRLTFLVVENYVKHAWAKFGIKRTMLHEGFFFFQFATRAGIEHVLKNGPWRIRLIPIVLNIWIANTRLKKDDIKVAPVCVKIYKVPIVAYSEEDAYTSTMCLKSWGRNTYVRELMEVSVEVELVDSLVVVIHYQNKEGHSLETVEIEYEWRPPRCDKCKIFDHKDNDCPKNVKEVSPNLVDEDGFVQAPRPFKDSHKKGFMAYGINIMTLKNSFESLMQDDKILDVAQSNDTDNTNGENAYEDDDDDVEEVFIKQQRDMNQTPKQKEVRQIIHENNLCVCAILESHVGNFGLDKLCPKVFWYWHWTSNGAVCVKGSRIILGWNPDVVNVIVISFDDQVMHTCFKANKKDLFCSWIYAHSRYQQRRELWQNLQTHKSYIREMPWCLLVDFNVSLSIDDKSTSASFVDTAMRDF
ncbi:hypothetical protein Tco_1007387 [Tanacetum coccineum]